MVIYLILFPGESSVDPANIPRVPSERPAAPLLLPTSSPKSVEFPVDAIVTNSI